METHKCPAFHLAGVKRPKMIYATGELMLKASRKFIATRKWTVHCSLFTVQVSVIVLCAMVKVHFLCNNQNHLVALNTRCFREVNDLNLDICGSYIIELKCMGVIEKQGKRKKKYHHHHQNIDTYFGREKKNSCGSRFWPTHTLS